MYVQQFTVMNRVHFDLFEDKYEWNLPTAGRLIDIARYIQMYTRSYKTVYIRFLFLMLTPLRSLERMLGSISVRVESGSSV